MLADALSRQYEEQSVQFINIEEADNSTIDGKGVNEGTDRDESDDNELDDDAEQENSESQTTEEVVEEKQEKGQTTEKKQKSRSKKRREARMRRLVFAKRQEHEPPTVPTYAQAMYFEAEQRGKRVPDNSDRVRLVQEAHAFGHFGVESMVRRLSADGYWWPLMRHDLEKELASCDACLRYNVSRHGFHPATSVLADKPMDHLQVDTVGPIPASESG